MVTRLLTALLLCVFVAAATASATQTDQPAGEKPKKTKAAKPKDQSKAKNPSKVKKPKKAAADVPAPDEPVDPDAIVERGERGWRFSWKQHPSLRYGSIFRMDGEAKFQEDAHGSYPNASNLACPNQTLPTPCVWELHRNRVGIQGYLFKHIEYEVERELTEQELSEKDILLGYTPKSMWKDVNVNLTYIKNAQIQIGKFKVPFGLDEMTGVSHNDFVYRSLGANYLAPARDIGGMVHGRFFKHGLNYWAGVFQHDGDNARSKKIQGGDQTFAARVTGTPFRQLTAGPLGSMELGSAFAISALSDDSFRPNGLRGRTVLTQDTFYESVYVKGHRRRWEGDADWTIGRASARAEYTWVSDDRNGQGLNDENLPDARGRSWYTSGTWIVTGEKKRRPVRPAEDFLQGGWGALEVVGRYERLWFDSVGSSANAYRNPRAEVIVPSGVRALTIGANWTLNRFVKLQFNGIREHVEDPDRSPVPNSDAFWSRVLRLQFVL
jgi:phosphate-selective porin OprO/OprP